MFNLAQRQLRLSLWGTELANRSTGIDSNPAEEALFAVNAWDLDPNFTKVLLLWLSGGLLLPLLLKSILWSFSMQTRMG